MNVEEEDFLWKKEIEKLDLHEDSARQRCIDDIMNTYYKVTGICHDRDNYYNFSHMTPEEFKDVLDIYLFKGPIDFENYQCFSISEIMRTEFDGFLTSSEQCLNDSILDYFNGTSRIVMFGAMRDLLSIEEEKAFFATYLALRCYQMLLFNDDTDFLEPEENDLLFDLDNVNGPTEAVNIVLNNVEIIADFAYSYVTRTKSDKDIICEFIKTEGKYSNCFKICPMMFMENRFDFNMLIDREIPEFAEIGYETINYVDEEMQFERGHKNKNIYVNAANMICYQDLDYDIEKWFMYLLADVYRMLKICDKKTDSEIKIIQLVEKHNDQIQTVLADSSMQGFLIYEFYKLHKGAFNIDDIKSLNKMLSEEKQGYLKKINPYDDLEKVYFKTR